MTKYIILLITLCFVGNSHCMKRIPTVTTSISKLVRQCDRREKTMQYKGYVGRMAFDDKTNLYYGAVLGIKAIIIFKGGNVEKAATDFRESVDYYLKCCKRNGKEPETHSCEKYSNTL